MTGAAWVRRRYSDGVAVRESSLRPAVAKSGTFGWNGHELAYELYGDADGTPCVLVHGILLDSHINRGLALGFAAEGYRVALLDLLGHGRSGRGSGAADYRIDAYGEQMIALLDHLGWGKALIGGVSLGALAALQVAAQAPERLLGLFLEMPLMERSTPPAAMILVPLLAIVHYGRFAHRPLARWLRGLRRPRNELLTSVLNAVSLDSDNVAGILHGVLVGPVVPPRAQRQAITVPTLVIGHGGDLLHELSDAKALAREIPDACLLRARSVIELRTRPKRLWPDVSRFLQTVAGTAREPRKHTKSSKTGKRTNCQ